MKLVLISLLVIGLVYGSPVVEVELVPPSHSVLENDGGDGFTNEIQSRIVNGQRAKRGQFPWQALLTLRGKTNAKTRIATCGASLISEKHLITAAHCVNSYEALTGIFWNCTNINVELGSTRSETGVSVDTTEYFVHPEWNYDDVKTDIAIIRLPIAYDKIKGYNPKFISPISLPMLGENLSPSDRYNEFIGQSAIASGFGITRSGYTSNDILNYVSLKVIDNDICSHRFHAHIDKSKICTSPDKKRISSACSGDSGGPLVIKKSSRPILIGVASFVEHGCSGLTVFTRVTSYMDFICQYATDLNCHKM